MWKAERSEDGSTSFGGLMWLAAIGVVVYFGFMYVPVYAERYEVRQLLHEAGNKAYLEKNDDQIRRFISSKLKTIGSHYEIRDGQEYNLPGIVVLDDDIHVNREPDVSIVLQVNYTKVINYPFTQKQKQLDFNPSVKADLTAVKW